MRSEILILTQFNMKSYGNSFPFFFFRLMISSFFNILIDAQVDSFNNWLCFEINKDYMKLDDHKLLKIKAQKK